MKIVFNYYLYPEQLTGYILMEFVDGEEIHGFMKNNPEKVNDIFLQTINGFKYLENIEVLHRDIRPQNILVSSDGIVKIIDYKITVCHKAIIERIWRFAQWYIWGIRNMEKRNLWIKMSFK